MTDRIDETLEPSADPFADLVEPPRTRGERSSTRRTDWRLGGRTVARWRDRTLGVGILALGVGLIGGGVAGLLVPVAWKGLVSGAILWICLLAAVIWAFSRSRPIGLLRFWGTDLLWGLGLGVVLRLCQGWIDVATGGSGALPTYPGFDGRPLIDPFGDIVAPVVIAPLIEEFFFRAVILVCIYTLLRRVAGKFVAGLAAALVSTALFVIAHLLVGGASIGGILSLSLLGAVCAALVLLTGRIWGAVLVHAVYNGTWVLLAIAGTLLA